MAHYQKKSTQQQRGKERKINGGERAGKGWFWAALKGDQDQRRVVIMNLD